MSEEEFNRSQGNKKYYQSTSMSSNYVDQWIVQQSCGKVFLDYACGNGFQSVKAAKAGADISIGLDISSVSIDNSRRNASEEDVSERTYFFQGDCENTMLPDNSIDTIICSGMLHHLDLDKAFKELFRILKPGGQILAVEALNYNPIIRLYRALTPEMRTEWEKEHILSLKDVAVAKKYFLVRNVRYWHLMSILATPFRKTKLFAPLLSVFNNIDKIILRIPLVRLLAWMFTFEMVKPVRQ